MTRAEELKTIMESVINGHYTEDDLELFKAEYGWADWMCDYTEAADDEGISESESKVIDEILEEGFKMAFNSEYVETYLFEKGKDFFTTEESYNEAIRKINAEYEEGSEPYDYLITDNFADYHYKEIINDYQIYGVNANSNQFLVIKESDDKSEWLETYFFVNHTPEEIKKFLANK